MSLRHACLLVLAVVAGPHSGGGRIVWFRSGDAFVFSARSADGSTFAPYRTDGTDAGTVRVATSCHRTHAGCESG